jgi:hypothetical protein
MWYQIAGAVQGLGTAHMSLMMGLMKASSSGLALGDFAMRAYVFKRRKKGAMADLAEDAVADPDAAELGLFLLCGCCCKS